MKKQIIVVVFLFLICSCNSTSSTESDYIKGRDNSGILSTEAFLISYEYNELILTVKSIYSGHTIRHDWKGVKMEKHYDQLNLREGVDSLISTFDFSSLPRKYRNHVIRISSEGQILRELNVFCPIHEIEPENILITR